MKAGTASCITTDVNVHPAWELDFGDCVAFLLTLSTLEDCTMMHTIGFYLCLWEAVELLCILYFTHGETEAQREFLPEVDL